MLCFQLVEQKCAFNAWYWHKGKLDHFSVNTENCSLMDDEHFVLMLG